MILGLFLSAREGPRNFQTASETEENGYNFPTKTKTKGYIVIGETAYGKISERPFPDRDWFKVDILASKTYIVEMNGVTAGTGRTLTDPYINGVHDASGNRLDGTVNDNAGKGIVDSEIRFSPPSDGAYFIEAASSLNQKGNTLSFGTYSLSIRDASVEVTEETAFDDDYAANATSTGIMAQGIAVTGEIQDLADRDWIKGYFQSGVQYEIRVKGAATGDGTMTHPRIKAIYNSDGNKLIGGDAGDINSESSNDDIVVEFSASGNYFVEIYRSTFSSMGTYTLIYDEYVETAQHNATPSGHNHNDLSYSFGYGQCTKESSHTNAVRASPRCIAGRTGDSFYLDPATSPPGCRIFVWRADPDGDTPESRVDAWHTPDKDHRRWEGHFGTNHACFSLNGTWYKELTPWGLPLNIRGEKGDDWFWEGNGELIVDTGAERASLIVGDPWVEQVFDLGRGEQDGFLVNISTAGTYSFEVQEPPAGTPSTVEELIQGRALILGISNTLNNWDCPGADEISEMGAPTPDTNPDDETYDVTVSGSNCFSNPKPGDTNIWRKIGKVVMEDIPAGNYYIVVRNYSAAGTGDHSGVSPAFYRIRVVSGS